MTADITHLQVAASLPDNEHSRTEDSDPCQDSLDPLQSMESTSQSTAIHGSGIHKRWFGCFKLPLRIKVLPERDNAVIWGPIFKKIFKICPKIVLRCVLSLSYDVDLRFAKIILRLS